MDFEMEPYIVYIQVDEQNRIIAVNSSAFLTDINGWIEIDSGYGDKYHHAQGNYFNKPLYDERGLCNYKFENSEVAERTAEEIDADYKEPEVSNPSTPSDPALINRILDLEARLASYESAYIQGVNEA